MNLSEELAARLGDRPYVARWFGHREHLEPWPEGEGARWQARTVRAVTAWAQARAAEADPGERQEDWALSGLADGSLSWTDARRLAGQLYPDWSRAWPEAMTDDADHRRGLHAAWTAWRERRRDEARNRRDARDLPAFHRELWGRIRRLAEAEAAVRGLLTERDLGWDLEQGLWDDLDFAPLEAVADDLAREPGLQRIAELLGRDYRSRFRPPPPLPPPPRRDPEPEPGRTEIRGVRFGNEWASLVSSEASLLAFPDTQHLFFKKAAEGELLVWDQFSAAVPPPKDPLRNLERQKRNDRGPIVVALDTSGSMRGKPEQVAKAAVLALLRVALDEGRACYLINFSSEVRCLDLSDLGRNLPGLLRFLAFSFHGGTDLAPALREGLRVLQDGAYREADVLVISDFAVPKIPAPLRQAVRRQQEDRGTRFYSLTVSVRPLNDFLNVFDAGWVYNIHPFQNNGIARESLEALG